jgi:cell wall-associated NlpC family hydrolase
LIIDILQKIIIYFLFLFFKTSSSILILFIVISAMMTSCSSTKKYSDNGRSFTKQRVKNTKAADHDDIYLDIEASTSNKKYIPKSSKEKPNKKAIFIPSRNAQTSSTQDSIRELIYETASQYLGLKYRSGGRTPSTGFDCSGFVAFVMGEHNIKIGGSSVSMARLGDLRNKHELKMGDLVFFGKNGNIHHVGIVSRNQEGELEMIHSASSVGISIDIINNSKYWSDRFMYGKDIITSFLLNGKIH